MTINAEIALDILYNVFMTCVSIPFINSLFFMLAAPVESAPVEEPPKAPTPPPPAGKLQ